MKSAFPIAAGLACLFAGTALAAAVVGQPAPAFTATDLSGKAVSLADFKGRTVVLEWNNFGCPFVQKHYRSGNMQALQKKYAGDVVWLAVNSTNAGHQDYIEPAKLSKALADFGAAPARYLMDESGSRGPRLRRQGHAAHVRDRPRGQGGLQRGHRRQALRGPGRREDREELRGRRARGAQGRKARGQRLQRALRLHGEVPVGCFSSRRRHARHVTCGSCQGLDKAPKHRVAADAGDAGAGLPTPPEGPLPSGPSPFPGRLFEKFDTNQGRGLKAAYAVHLIEGAFHIQQ